MEGEGEGQTEGQQPTDEGGQEKPPAVPETARRDPEAPQTVQEAIAEARQKAEEGDRIDVEEAEEAPTPDLEAEAEETPPQEEEPAEEEIERPELQIDEAERLPEDYLEEHGYQYDVHGRLHAPNGDFVSLQGHEELRQRAEEGLAPDEPLPEAEEDVEEPEAEEEETDEQEEPEEDEEGPDESLLVEIPGREPDESVTIMADDEETAERLRQLANEGMRRKEFKRQMESLEADRQEFREVARAFEADPAGFLAEQVTDQEIREEAALRLLADDEVFDAVQSRLREWDMEPAKRERDLYKMKDRSRTRRDEATREERVRTTARQAARDVRRHIEDLVPPSMSDERARKFMKVGMEAVGQAMVQSGRFDVSQDDVVHVLDQAGYLDGFGVNPSRSGNGRSPGDGASEESRSTRRVRAVDPDSDEAKKARRTGEELKKEAEAGRAAAATPQGAGASAASQVSPPEGQSVEERIKWVKEKGLGAILQGQ